MGSAHLDDWRRGGIIGAIDIGEGVNQVVRDITIATGNDQHAQKIVDAVKAVPSSRCLTASSSGTSAASIQQAVDGSPGSFPKLSRSAAGIESITPPRRVFNVD